MCDEDRFPNRTPRELEGECLELWRAGDQAAGQCLVQRLAPQLTRFFQSKLGRDGEDEVQDLLQETFAVLVARRDTIAQPRSVRAFANAIARHHLYAYIKRKTRNRLHFDPLTHSVADLRPGIVTDLGASQEAQLLLSAMQSLPLQSQTELYLYYIERMPQQEIADSFGVTAGAIANRLLESRRRLRAKVSELSSSPELTASVLEDLDYWTEQLRAAFFE